MPFSNKNPTSVIPRTYKAFHMASAPCITTSVDEAGATTISALHPDIIRTHILTRLPGPALASAAAASSQLYALASHEHLWANLCRFTWPSTTSPRIRHVISNFPHGSRSFFSDSFPIPHPTTTTTRNSHVNINRTPELISAVDLHCRQQLLLSKVVEIETVTDWFRCSPFRVDLLDPKEVVQTPIRYPEGENERRELGEDLTLSWIVIDPSGRRAMNLSSHKPVSVQRHWLSGEVEVQFVSVLAGNKGSSSELGLCSLLVVCVGVEGGEMQVRETSLQMEDMDGMQLNGRDSLVIIQRALEGKREIKIRAEEDGRERWQEFVNRKRERKKRKMRAEGILDVLCVSLAALTFAGFFWSVCLLQIKGFVLGLFSHE